MESPKAPNGQRNPQEEKKTGKSKTPKSKTYHQA